MADRKLAPQDIARKARAALRAEADPVRARGAERYFKDTIKCYGVAAPDVHALAAELYGLVKADWTVRRRGRALRHPGPRSRARGQGGRQPSSCAGSRSTSRPPSSPGSRPGWPPTGSTTGPRSTSFCTDGMGAFLERYPAYVEKIKAWAFHPNRWVKRASLVSFIKLARKPEFLAGDLRDLGFGLPGRRRPRPEGQRLAPPGGGQGRRRPAWSGSSWSTGRPSRARPCATPSSAFRRPGGRRFFSKRNRRCQTEGSARRSHESRSRDRPCSWPCS
ncbi:MAG: DNA alkylation repair protein [Candidatus Moduliflexus flocculans]|nr:DNA alkylation repair protein [Candidatus Moduliflexus flocculans]